MRPMQLLACVVWAAGFGALAQAQPGDSVAVDLTGRVVDPGTAPLAGATVRLGGLSTVSDARGEFRLKGFRSVGIGPRSWHPGLRPRVRQGRLRFSVPHGNRQVILAVHRPDGPTLASFSRTYPAGSHVLDLREVLPRATGGVCLMTLRVGDHVLAGRLRIGGNNSLEADWDDPVDAAVAPMAKSAARDPDTLHVSLADYVPAADPVSAHVGAHGDVVLHPVRSRLPLVPWPQAVLPSAGRLALSSRSRILAGDSSLMGLAKVLAAELAILSGLDLGVVRGDSGLPGDLVLRLDPALPGHLPSRTVVDDRITVSGRTAQAATLGSANILQLVSVSGTVPKVRIEDNSPTAYSELMLDVARKPNSLAVMKRCIVLCRLYKIPFFRLHLSDVEAWTFPSKAYPELGRSNLYGVRAYTRAELDELVRFAEARGIVVIPGIEVLGHSTAMRRDRPDLFGTAAGLDVNNIASETYYTAMGALLGEVAEVFRTSPWIHIGEDEFFVDALFKHASAQDYLKARGITTSEGLWVDHLHRMNALVKGLGRKTALWEGFPAGVGQALTPKSDFLLYIWDGRFYNPLAARSAGFPIVSVPWNPSIYNTPEENYAWNMWLLGSQDRKPDQLPIGDPAVVGGSMVLWERYGEEAVYRIRRATPARQERIYHPSAGRTFADFKARGDSADAILQKLLRTAGEVLVPTGFLMPGGTVKFGKRPVDAGPSAPIACQVVNNGDVDLEVRGVSLTGAAGSPFAIRSDSGERILKPGKVRTIEVVFDPFPGAIVTGYSLTAATNDPARPTHNLPLQGEY